MCIMSGFSVVQSDMVNVSHLQYPLLFAELMIPSRAVDITQEDFALCDFIFFACLHLLQYTPGTLWELADRHRHSRCCRAYAKVLPVRTIRCLWQNEPCCLLYHTCFKARGLPGSVLHTSVGQQSSCCPAQGPHSCSCYLEWPRQDLHRHFYQLMSLQKALAGCPQQSPQDLFGAGTVQQVFLLPWALVAHLKMPIHESIERVVKHCSRGENNIEPHRKFCIFKHVLDQGQRCNKLPTEFSVKV